MVGPARATLIGPSDTSTMTPPPNCPLPHRRWACDALFGRLAGVVIGVCTALQGDPRGPLACMGAAFLLDQAKAFEYLSHGWLRQVLRAWKLPSWAVAAFLAQAEGRSAYDPRLHGARIPLFRRGVGMGGPLSPLTWCMAFDPICWIAGIAAMCELLGYVDDLLALVFGPGHAMPIYLALLAATKAAGLVVEDHSCAWWVGSAGFATVQEILAPFPTTVTVGPDGHDSFTITGGPVDVYAQLLRMAQVLPGGCRLYRCSRACNCKAKHLLVPACRISEWAAALNGSPLAAACAPGGRFLGAYLFGKVRPHDASPTATSPRPTPFMSAHSPHMAGRCPHAR